LLIYRSLTVERRGGEREGKGKGWGKIGVAEDEEFECNGSEQKPP
jgi:hypothetical protein